MATKNKMTLDDLVSQLRQALGTALQSVVLYGSAASGEQVAGRSDQNVLVIVDALDLNRVRSLAQTARAWRESGNPLPLILTTAEWRSSADIFPMEYADILERNRVLHGEAPFDGIRVRRSELRLQLEHESMGTLLRLRAGVMAAGTDAARQASLLADSLSTLMVIFRALLRLHGETPAKDYHAVVGAVAARTGLDAAPFTRVIAAQRGAAPLAGSEADAILRAYVAGMEQLVSHLDALILPVETD